MVCTLLAGVNVVAFAADGSDTLSVHAFYNDALKGGDGEHLFTKDADEMSWLASLPTWNDEGEAWKAPASSSTAVWRCYNPNSGEHLYVDEDYADFLESMKWNKEKVAFYSDDNMGVPVYRLWNGQDAVGSHYFTTDKDEAEFLVIAYGWTMEDVAFYGVKEESAEVKLVDKSGLQSDGTAYETDVLAVVYGVDFGTPAVITWYKDGAVAASYSAQAFATGLTNEDIMDANNDKMPTGNWFVTVENTKGNTFKTNTITVTDEAEDAIISDFALSDAYDAIPTWGEDVQKADTAAAKMAAAAMVPVEAKAMTTKEIVDVTLEKELPGYFYLLDGDTTKVTAEPTHVAYNNANVAEVKANKFSNTTLYEEYRDNTKTGIKYTDSEGSVHYKFFSSMFVAGGIERGTDYIIGFSEIDKNVTGKTVDELNVVDEAETCPYLMAPTSVAVDTKKVSVTTAGWQAQLYVGDMPAAYIVDLNGTDAGKDMKLFSSSAKNTKEENSTPMGGNLTTLIAGKNAADNICVTTANTDEYAYATWVGDEDIFGEEITLVSQVVEVAPPVAQEVTVEYDVTSPEDITVNFSNLRADATAFLVTADYDTNDETTLTKALTNFKDNQKFVAAVPVEKGDAEATFEDVLSKVKNTTKANSGSVIGVDGTVGDVYAVVVVPNSSDYTMVSSWDGDGHVLYSNDTYALVTQMPVYFSLTGKTTNIDITDMSGTKLAALDQFGQKYVPEIDLPVAVCDFDPITQAQKDKDSELTVSATANVLTVAQGQAYSTLAGDQYSYELPNGQNIVLTVKTAGANAQNSVWTVAIK